MQGPSIDKHFTTITLGSERDVDINRLGGNPPSFWTAGGALIDKSAMIRGNLYVGGLMTGNVCAQNILVETIEEKFYQEGITIIGNLNTDIITVGELFQVANLAAPPSVQPSVINILSDLNLNEGNISNVGCLSTQGIQLPVTLQQSCQPGIAQSVTFAGCDLIYAYDNTWQSFTLPSATILSQIIPDISVASGTAVVGGQGFATPTSPVITFRSRAAQSFQATLTVLGTTLYIGLQTARSPITINFYENGPLAPDANVTAPIPGFVGTTGPIAWPGGLTGVTFSLVGYPGLPLNGVQLTAGYWYTVEIVDESAPPRSPMSWVANCLGDPLCQAWDPDNVNLFAGTDAATLTPSTTNTGSFYTDRTARLDMLASVAGAATATVNLYGGLGVAGPLLDTQLVNVGAPTATYSLYLEPGTYTVQIIGSQFLWCSEPYTGENPSSYGPLLSIDVTGTYEQTTNLQLQSITDTAGPYNSGYIQSQIISQATDGNITITPVTIPLVGSGTALTEAFGGTNQTFYMTGDMLYAGGPDMLAKLTIGSPGDVLTVMGGIPQWSPGGGGGNGTVTSVIAGVGLDGGVITVSGTIDLADTAVTPGSYNWTDLTVDAQGRLTAASSNATPVTSFATTLSGLTTNMSTGAVSLGGTLAVAGGGTGGTSFTAGGVLFGNAGSALGVSMAGTAGQLLISDGVMAPTWTSTPTVTSLTITESPITNAMHAVTKAYVDAAVAGLNVQAETLFKTTMPVSIDANIKVSFLDAEDCGPGNNVEWIATNYPDVTGDYYYSYGITLDNVTGDLYTSCALRDTVTARPVYNGNGTFAYNPPVVNRGIAVDKYDTNGNALWSVLFQNAGVLDLGIGFTESGNNLTRSQVNSRNLFTAQSGPAFNPVTFYNASGVPTIIPHTNPIRPEQIIVNFDDSGNFMWKARLLCAQTSAYWEPVTASTFQARGIQVYEATGEFYTLHMCPTGSPSPFTAGFEPTRAEDSDGVERVTTTATANALFWLITKWSATGFAIWMARVQNVSANFRWAGGLAVDQRNGDVVVLCGIQTPSNIYNSNGTLAATIPLSTEQYILAKYTSAGNFVWYSRFYLPTLSNISINNTTGDIFCSARFQPFAPSDFYSPNSAVIAFSRPTPPANESGVGKWDENGVPLWAVSFRETIPDTRMGTLSIDEALNIIYFNFFSTNPSVDFYNTAVMNTATLVSTNASASYKVPFQVRLDGITGDPINYVSTYSKTFGPANFNRAGEILFDSVRNALYVTFMPTETGAGSFFAQNTSGMEDSITIVAADIDQKGALYKFSLIGLDCPIFIMPNGTIDGFDKTLISLTGNTYSVMGSFTQFGTEYPTLSNGDIGPPGITGNVASMIWNDANQTWFITNNNSFLLI